MPKIHVNGIDLFYTIEGDNQNEPLLMIAGFDCDISIWSMIMPLLIEKYQVITFDNRGIGRSSAPNSPYSIQQMAEDAAQLLEYLNITKVYVVGHSMGGQIAQELAIAYPEIVQGLILIASWAKGNEKFYNLIKTFGDLADKLDLKSYHQVLLPWMFSSRFFAIPGAIETVIDLIVNNPFPPEPHGLYHQSRAIINNDISDYLHKINCPTLVLVSQDDLVTPVSFSVALTQGIPNAKLTVMENGSHNFLIESPDQITQIILNFFSSMGR